jgi:hypothetical protein
MTDRLTLGTTRQWSRMVVIPESPIKPEQFIGLIKPVDARTGKKGEKFDGRRSSFCRYMFQRKHRT